MASSAKHVDKGDSPVTTAENREGYKRVMLKLGGEMLSLIHI